MKKSARGFTLIELLLVVTVLAVLAVAVFAALNPAQRLKDTKNARRTTDVDTILTAIHSYIIDNKGALPAGLTAGMTEKQLGSDVTGCILGSVTRSPSCNVALTADCVNLATPLAPYLSKMPIDPSGYDGNVATTADASASAGKTNYSIIVDSNGIVTVKACITDAQSGLTRATSNTIFASR
jgi:prepilin-type N-terminal cleavage/methylation domain-containing protein